MSDMVTRKLRHYYILGIGATLETGFHHGKKCLYAEIYVGGPLSKYRDQTRTIFAQTSHELLAKVRLALARGPSDIKWDEDVIKRLTEESSSVEESWVGWDALGMANTIRGVRK